jgi:hypothetical protein
MRLNQSHSYTFIRRGERMHASCIKSKGQEPELYLIHHKKREKKEKERKWKREQNTFLLLLEQHEKNQRRIRDME